MTAQIDGAATDVFVINTPLQLLNAIEAVAAYGSVRPHLLILHWPRWPRRAFEGSLARVQWASVTWLPRDDDRPAWKPRRIAEYIWTLHRARERHTLEVALSRYGTDINLLAIGNYCQVFMRHVLNVVPHKVAVALDDGTDSLKAADLRQAAFAGDGPSGEAAPSGLKARISQRWVDMDDRHPVEPVEFFSVYNLPSTAHTLVRRHAYEQLRSSLDFATQGEEVLFLGQPLAEDGYITPRTFEVIMRRVKGHYAGHDVVYVPHKRETDLSLGVVRDVGFKMVEFNDPIEVVLAAGQRQPKVLSSFFCSALENCGIIFGDLLALHAVRIPSADLIQGREEAERIYRYLEASDSADIRMIDISEGGDGAESRSLGAEPG